jgi:3-hydroxyanthranilate 3,4-dioxygenase
VALRKPIPFAAWIDEHRDRLKPPVGNQVVYKDNENFIVMVVGGPNGRKDYHYNETEEFYYMLEGDMVLKVIDEGQPVSIPIRQGEIFLLPPKVPHSPQRPAGSIGMVMELHRRPGERDGLLWFCENCGNKLYEEYFELEDIVSQLPPVMARFYDNLEHRTCKACGAVMEPPAQPGNPAPKTN